MFHIFNIWLSSAHYVLGAYKLLLTIVAGVPIRGKVTPDKLEWKKYALADKATPAKQTKKCVMVFYSRV